MKQKLMIALYSIKPVYSEQIMNGSKIYELRKRMPVRKLDYMLIYSSSPISKIIGYAKIKKIHKNSIADTWILVSRRAGIPEKDYLEYFSGCQFAYAIELDVVKRFVKPFNIDELNPEYVPPQSFLYVEQNEFKRVIRRKTELV